MILEEVAGPFGVPDFVAVVGDHEAAEARIALGVPLLFNETDAGIASVLSASRGRTPNSIAAILRWSPASVERRLPTLVNTGAVARTSTGRYLRPPELKPIGRFYAIETKVREWRRAVYQGRRYRLWTDNYIVVMPKIAANPLAELQELVTNDGGGLVVDGRWIKRPSRHSLPARQRLWGSEHVVAALAGSPA